MGTKAAASHPSGSQAVPPHGEGSAGQGTRGRKHLAWAQLGTAGFSPLPRELEVVSGQFFVTQSTESPCGA